jgi:hypothetical protein
MDVNNDIFIFEHEIEDPQDLKNRIDELLRDASDKELKTIYRIVEAIVK